MRGFSRDRDAAGADQFLDAKRLEHVDHRLDLFDIAGNLDGVRVSRRVDDLGAEYIGQTNRFVAMFWTRVDFDESGFPIEKLRFGQVDHFEHLNNLVELLHDLLDDPVVADRHDRDHRGGWVQSWSDRQAFYVVASGAKETGNPGEHTKFVLNENRNNMFHPRRLSGRENTLTLIYLSFVSPALSRELQLRRIFKHHLMMRPARGNHRITVLKRIGVDIHQNGPFVL